MKQKKLVTGLCGMLSIVSLPAFSQSRVIDTADQPRIFAPGTFSTPYAEWSLSFTPDGNTAYSSLGSVYWTIICAEKQGSGWKKPYVAAFSGKFRDTDPFLTPDSGQLFVISSRPAPGMPQDKPQRAVHIWFVRRQVSGWGSPAKLETTINVPGTDNYAPSVSASGTLFYCSRRGAAGTMQSFCCKWLGNHFDRPRQLTIKGANEIQDPFIAPDESYLLFVNGSDIFISFKRGEAWSEAENLGPSVNNGDANSSPSVSPDGNTLYYSSARIQGFYKRNLTGHTAGYSELVKENGGLFNHQPNILMIPIHLKNKTGGI